MCKNKSFVKKHGILILLVVSALLSCAIDFIFKVSCDLFHEINSMLFTLVTVVAGFWVTCYLLFIEKYKDRFPLDFLKEHYLPQMKYNLTYVVFCVVFGCVVVIRDDGFFGNICFDVSALFVFLKIMKYVHDTSKTLMLNTYITELCDEISKKLCNKENSVKKDAFKQLRYVLDECVVKEEYSVAQNISVELGKVFRNFLENSMLLLKNGEHKEDIEDSFDRIVNLGIDQIELCKEINSELLIADISKQQIKNIDFCIEAEQYEWFKKYIKRLCEVTFLEQKEGNDKVVSEIFHIYMRVLETLIREEKEEWICYMLRKLFSMTNSLNFQSQNINLKYFASLIVYGLLHCENRKMRDSIYEVFEKFTKSVGRISKGFTDIKVYYALYFSDIRDDDERILQFFEMIFENGYDSVNDVTWTEFKFYCISEVMEKKNNSLEEKINKYHISLLISIIEMKDTYTGYLLLPKFKSKLSGSSYVKDEVRYVYDNFRYLLNKCIINDNLNFFFILLRRISECMMRTETQNKDLQVDLFDLFVWLIGKTKRLTNKQYIEIIFIELEEIIDGLDKKGAISKDFGDQIISKLSTLAERADSDNQNVVFEVIELFARMLKEGEEWHFISNFPDRKEKLYKGLFNIATSCIENDFEEGLRRCSNTMGWFTIYSLKQGNAHLTQYLIKLYRGMLELSMDMDVSTKTQVFILTLFTTVGMFCCKDPVNLGHINVVLSAIEKVDKRMIYTAIKMRTYENDMWDDLLDKRTKELTGTFKEKYDEHQRKREGRK